MTEHDCLGPKVIDSSNGIYTNHDLQSHCTLTMAIIDGYNKTSKVLHSCTRGDRFSVANLRGKLNGAKIISNFSGAYHFS